MSTFDSDPFPGYPKILFVGIAHSSHTHAWIDLLGNTEFNIRLFSTPDSHLPPHSWKVRTYISSVSDVPLDPTVRRSLYPYLVSKIPGSRVIFPRLFPRAAAWLAEIIRKWKPDIIHTLGLDPAGHFYWQVRKKYHLDRIGTWIVQLRGGSDLSLSRFDPDLRGWMSQILCECDQILSDNLQNVRFIEEMGIDTERVAPIVPVPGTGGVDVSQLSSKSQNKPSERRIILWPKAYTSPWSVALPVLEGLQLCWDAIQPCKLNMLVPTPDVEMWYKALPETIRKHTHLTKRIPRDDVLAIMLQSRVMLAPSLIDGVPNSLFEAMATGAFPIVSPLETITPIVKAESNVLFARNLYPQEIAEALVRAMTDDNLVDQAAHRNLTLVGEIADRAIIGPRVINYYKNLFSERKTQ